MVSRAPIFRLLSVVMLCAALAVGGCGSDGESQSESPRASEPPITDPAGNGEVSDLPAPEPGGELSQSDRDAVTDVTRDYIAALDAHDGAAVCELLEPGVTDQVKLPVTGADCAASLDASIGHGHAGGTPQWRHTRLVEVNAVSVGEDTARVTATVVHVFSDRNYPSVEEDVIYLDRSGGSEEWRIAKPSGSLYRAVGYPEPPLRAFTAP